MTKAIKGFKATRDESDRWEAALKAEGRTLSEVCRTALNRLAKRVEREQQENSK